MPKIKDRIARIKSVISIKTYKKPLLYIIMLMLFINIAILTVAAFIALAIDPSFSSFIDAFANGSLKWMLTPNAILLIDNPNTLILAVIVLMFGLVLFSGTIIALTTNAIKDYIQKKNSGSGKILLDKQIVILNWNSKVPELVADLLFVESEPVTVIILAQIEKEFAEKQIINAIHQSNHKGKLNHLNILVKNGDPLLQDDLEDITISQAKAILIMNLDDNNEVYTSLSKSDLNVIKTILSLGPVKFIYDPPIVVEIKHIETKEKILTLANVVKTLGEHKILPICFDRRLGQIIAQTLIDHNMESVYLSLFSFEGSEVYALENQTFEDCLKQNSHAIPLAFENNQLFVLSLNNQLKHKQSPHPYKPITLKTKKIDEAYDIDIYIVGENNKLSFIMEAFSQYESMHNSHFRAVAIKDEEMGKVIKALNSENKKATILLLSDEKQSKDALDANVINHLIELEGQLKNANVRIIVELLDPKNDYIVKDFSIENTIISNKIISLLLSKLALFKETAYFYEQLLTIAPNKENIDDQSVIIRKADILLNMKFPIEFSSIKQCIESFYESFKKQYMVFGMMRDEQLMIFEGDLHETKKLDIVSDDLIIMMRI